MAFTYNPAIAAGQVRLLIGDTVDVGHQFEDADIAAFLSMASDSINLAAAKALRSWASTIARGAQRLKALDIEVDNKGRAAELLNLAKALEEAEDDGGFAIAEWAEGGFGVEERMEKELQRNR